MGTKWGVNAMKKNQKVPNIKGFEYDEEELVMGKMLSQKPTIDLIQNCDLPPPMKIFTGVDNKTFTSSLRKKKSDGLIYEDGGDGKVGLLKALRLSQTRAREAEDKWSTMSKEKDNLFHGLMEDSIRLFGYKQLVRLLEFQVNMLENENKMKCYDNGDDEGDNCGLTWIMALALCFGVVGFGFVLGHKYFWF